MKPVALFTHNAMRQESVAFHQATFRANRISIAYASPLIRQIYLGCLSCIDSAEVFVFHEAKEGHLIQHYLPELPVENLIEVPEPYDLFAQMNRFLEMCTEVDSDSPFLAIPLAHFPFSNTYFQALNVSLTLAEKAGFPCILGEQSLLHNRLRPCIVDQGVGITGQELTLATVTEYDPEDCEVKVGANNISRDCGVFAWRTQPARRRIDEIMSMGRQADTGGTISTFANLFSFSSIVGLHLVKGTLGWFDRFSDDALEIYPYGDADQSGNINLGSIAPANSLEIFTDAYRLADNSTQSASELLPGIHVVDSADSLLTIREDLCQLEKTPSFRHLAERLRGYLEEEL